MNTINTALAPSVDILTPLASFGGLFVAIALATIGVVIVRKMIKKAGSAGKRV